MCSISACSGLVLPCQVPSPHHGGLCEGAFRIGLWCWLLHFLFFLCLRADSCNLLVHLLCHSPVLCPLLFWKFFALKLGEYHLQCLCAFCQHLSLLVHNGATATHHLALSDQPVRFVYLVFPWCPCLTSRMFDVISFIVVSLCRIHSSARIPARKEVSIIFDTLELQGAMNSLNELNSHSIAGGQGEPCGGSRKRLWLNHGQPAGSLPQQSCSET